MMQRAEPQARDRRWLAAAFLSFTALAAPAAEAQMPRVERPVPQVQPIEAQAPGGGLEAFALIHRAPISLNAARGGGGLDAGWLVRLDLPPGKYIVSGSATFNRTDGLALPLDPSEDTPVPGAVHVTCEVGGLDQSVALDFYIESSSQHPYGSRTEAFHLAGTSGSGGIFLKCNPNGGASVGNIFINALKVDRLNLRVE